MPDLQSQTPIFGAGTPIFGKKLYSFVWWDPLLGNEDSGTPVFKIFMGLFYQNPFRGLFILKMIVATFDNFYKHRA